jgi:large subunit ribosomal protein L24
MKIKVGDTVSVISGKDKFKTAKVLNTYVSKNKVLLEGINQVTKHIKGKQGEQGKIIKIEKPIDASNVMIICPYTQKKTRIGYEGKGKDKKRFSKKAGKALEDKIIEPKKKK